MIPKITKTLAQDIATSRAIKKLVWFLVLVVQGCQSDASEKLLYGTVLQIV